VTTKNNGPMIRLDQVQDGVDDVRRVATAKMSPIWEMSWLYGKVLKAVAEMSTDTTAAAATTLAKINTLVREALKAEDAAGDQAAKEEKKEWPVPSLSFQQYRPKRGPRHK
jgi:hypothetical protein